MEMERVNKVHNQDRSGYRSTLIKKPFLGVLLLFAFLPFTASAGTLRKPPNNLGLVAYWPFNEGVGSTAGDASGNGHTGTLKESPTWTSGKLGRALSFDISDRIAFTNIITGTTNTISVWIYLTADCSNYSSIFAQDSVDGLYCYQSGSDNKLDFWYTATPPDHFSNTALALNRWYHVAIVNNAGSATFYLNGVADGTVASAPSFNANTIGGDTSLETFPGKLDEVRLYNRALSASDVYALYKSGATQINNSNKSPGTLSQDLTGYWTFDGKDMIQNVADVSGNGRNGRLVNYTSTTTAPGKVGQALTFNGVTGAGTYVNTTTLTSFMSSATGTVSLWLRPTGSAPDLSNAESMWDTMPAVSCSAVFCGFILGRANRTDLGQDRIWVWNGSSGAIGADYVVGEWAYFTWVHGNGLLSLYKNGDFVGSMSLAVVPNFSGNLYIAGNWSGSNRHWRGDLDEVRTYSRNLSATEIKQLYNLTLGTKVSKPAVNSLTTGLVGYFTFDGGDTNWGTNTMVNRGSVGGTVTLKNMSTTTSPAPGKVGQGLTFNGTNGYIDLGDVSVYKPTGSLAVSFWYKGLRGSTETFIGHSPQSLTNFWYITNSQAFFCGTGLCAKAVSKSYTLPNDNAWHHIVASLDRDQNPDTLTVYIDGVSQGTATGTANGGELFGTNTLIGAPSWGNGGWRQGPMDEVRIYNRTLSAAEALQIYRIGK
ncbi:MAG TPA: hypothetical protein DCS20_04500 [Candidatus Yonathbacteria bacterium]|nr:hypothetical protein [Candidatus Yonathbacteria bacterium]